MTQPLKKVGERGIGITIFAFAYLFFLYAPMLVLPFFSFADQTIFRFPIEGFSTRWYEELGERPEMITALWNSIQVGLIASILATIMGLLAAKAITRYAMPGKGVAMGLISLPLFIPEVLLGLALLIILNLASIPLSLVTIAMGHVMLCTPFAMSVLIARMDGFDKSLEEASMDLGESGWMTFWRVTFPLIAPAIVSSLLLTFIVSFDEFLLAFFLQGDQITLPLYIWGQLRFPSNFPPVLALGTCILLVSIVLVVFAEWLRQVGAQGDTPNVGVR
ncbi:MAG: ABC transporter permease [Alphaproteobacteria bacterium]|nr:ABC transporter permease [Alphaproteobacteria bacterium]